MATIRPLYGIRYNPDRIIDISKVVTPPYDVISAQEQEGYYQRHPYNIIRLIKGKDEPGDNEKENKYTRASRLFNTWCKEGVLFKESAPAIYLYEQVFCLENQTYSRRGFIANVKLEELNTGHIYPHEQTLSGPKEDRLRLIKACPANLDPVFSLYPENISGKGSIMDILGVTAQKPPSIDFTADHGIRNKLWILKDPNTIAKIIDLMADKPLFIADGHHRYETALIYRNQIRERTGKEPYEGGQKELSSDYVLMMCVSMHDPGLKILPAHRLIKEIIDFDPSEIKNKLQAIFAIESLGNGCSVDYITKKLRDNKHYHVFVLYLGGENRFYLLKLKLEKPQNNEFELEYSSWKYFDVGILHGIVFDQIFGLKHNPQAKGAVIEYVKDEAEAISLVDKKAYQMAFFLNPTRIEDVQMVAGDRQIMPPKATYFYPKLTTGMVINKL